MEGKILRHCVASYIKPIVEEKVIVLFLRRNEQIDRPFYTISIRNRYITQVKGFANKNINNKLLKSFVKNGLKIRI